MTPVRRKALRSARHCSVKGEATRRDFSMRAGPIFSKYSSKPTLPDRTMATKSGEARDFGGSDSVCRHRIDGPAAQAGKTNGKGRSWGRGDTQENQNSRFRAQLRRDTNTSVGMPGGAGAVGAGNSNIGRAGYL